MVLISLCEGVMLCEDDSASVRYSQVLEQDCLIFTFEAVSRYILLFSLATIEMNIYIYIVIQCCAPWALR